VPRRPPAGLADGLASHLKRAPASPSAARSEVLARNHCPPSAKRKRVVGAVGQLPRTIGKRKTPAQPRPRVCNRRLPLTTGNPQKALARPACGEHHAQRRVNVITPDLRRTHTRSSQFRCRPTHACVGLLIYFQRVAHAPACSSSRARWRAGAFGYSIFAGIVEGGDFGFAISAHHWRTTQLLDEVNSPCRL
jgi:hypothetical protein